MPTDDFASNQRPENTAPTPRITVRQWLSVHRPEDACDIWARDVAMPCVPVAGDRITLWADLAAESRFGTQTLLVKGRTFAVDGSPAVTLIPLLVNPGEVLFAHLRENPDQGAVWCPVDGQDLADMLLAGNWRIQ
jgi:hypothetical protein